MGAIGKWCGRSAAKVVLLTAAGCAFLAGVLFAGGAVLASGGGPKDTPAGSVSTSQQVRPHLLAGAYHADASWLMVDGATRTTSSDAGLITAVGDGSITIERADGESVGAPATDAACIRQDGRPVGLRDLKVGERARVVQEDGSVLMVRAGMHSRQPGTGCRLLEGVVHGDITVQFLDGSTKAIAYDFGLITGITSSGISLVRSDGQTVTVSYDETTFVLEEGAAGSVGDLKQGDRAMFFSEAGHADVIRCIKRLSA